MKTPNNQKLAIVWRVPSRDTLRYHVCYTETKEWLRITSIVEVRHIEDASRLNREDDHRLWAELRAAVVDGKQVLFVPRRQGARKGVAAR